MGVEMTFGRSDITTWAGRNKLVLSCLVAFAFAFAPAAAAAAAPDAPPVSTLALELEVQIDPARLKEAAQGRLDAARAHSDSRAELLELRRRTMAHYELGEYPAAARVAESGMPLARASSDVVAQCEFSMARALGLELSGQVGVALKVLDDAQSLAERENHPEMVARVLIRKGRILSLLNRDAEALGLFSAAHTGFEKTGDKLGMASALSSMANVAYKGSETPPRDAQRAVALLERASLLLDPNTQPRDTLRVTASLAAFYYTLKDLPAARGRYQRCLELAHAANDLAMVTYCSVGSGILARDEGRLDDSLAHLGEALRTRGGPSVPQLLATHLTRADVYSLKGDRPHSLAALAQAGQLLAVLHSAKSEAKYHRSAAVIHARLGDPTEAYRAMVELRRLEQAAQEVDNKKLNEEFKVRFDLQLKEKDNEVLRAEKQTFEAKRTTLILGLVLTFALAASLVFYLVRQIRQKRVFADLALHDELTGVHNRRSILEFARLHWSGRRAGDAGFAVAMLDIDHFKSVNDTHGHDAGDAVLIAFARACQAQLRHEDRLGRFGGEEFLVIMPGTKASEIPMIFERLRGAVHKLAIPGMPPEWRLTFSMGSAQTHGGIETLDQLIKVADIAMFKAKRGGRDRVFVEP